MSRQLTEALADQRAANAHLAAHIKICAVCRDAKDRKRPAHRCVIGQDLASAAQAAGRRTAAERRLDAAPIPGQQVLIQRDELELS